MPRTKKKVKSIVKTYAVWFDELGMQIAVGDTVRNDPKNKAFLSWEDVSCRIHQLLQQGEYASKASSIVRWSWNSPANVNSKHSAT